MQTQITCTDVTLRVLSTQEIHIIFLEKLTQCKLHIPGDLALRQHCSCGYTSFNVFINSCKVLQAREKQEDGTYKNMTAMTGDI
jgi:hypothetical protein